MSSILYKTYFLQKVVLQVGLFCFCLLFPMLSNAAGDLCQFPKSDKEWGKWLEKQEDMGGHTLGCHVNISISGLIGRIEKNQQAVHGCKLPLDGDSASSWSDKQILINVLKSVVSTHKNEINKGKSGRYIYEGKSSDKLGNTVRKYMGKVGKNKNSCTGRKDYECLDAKKWTVIFHKDNEQKTCYLLTAYPHN